MKTPLLLALLALPATAQDLLIPDFDSGRILRLDAFDGTPIDLDVGACAAPGADCARAARAFALGGGPYTSLRHSRGTLLVALGGPRPSIREHDARGALLDAWELDARPRGVWELGDGRLLWTSSRGVRVLDPTTGTSVGLAIGAGAPPLKRAGGAALKPPYVFPEVRVNVTGLNANGPDRMDGVSVAEDPTAPGTFLMVWAEQFGTSELTQDIYSARSTDNGAHWSTPVRVDLGEAANLHDSEFPKLSFAANGAALVVWEEHRDSAPLGSQGADLYFNRSSDGGLTWLPVSRALNSATAAGHVSSDVRHICLETQGNVIDVAWEEAQTTGNDRLWWTRSTNAGATWSVPVALTSGAGDIDTPRMLADGQRLHVVYVEETAGGDDVRYQRSTDGGLNWSTPTTIESNVSGDADAARLALDGDTLCATWLDEVPGGGSVHASVSLDGGLSWGAEVDLSPQVSHLPGTDADWPNAVVRGDDVFVVFNHDGQGVNRCFASRTLDGGQSWTLETPLDPGFSSHRPVIVSLAGLLAVRYERGPNGSNVTAFAYSTDDGATWIPAGPVPNAGPDVDEGNALEEGSFVVASEATRSVLVGHFDRPTGANEVYASVFLAPPGDRP